MRTENQHLPLSQHLNFLLANGNAVSKDLLLSRSLLVLAKANRENALRHLETLLTES
jgi:hypothetical protein